MKKGVSLFRRGFFFCTFLKKPFGLSFSLYITFSFFVFLFGTLPGSLLSAEEYALPENLRLHCDLEPFHGKRMKYMNISSERIDREGLLSLWFPDPSLAEYTTLKIMTKEIERYSSGELDDYRREPLIQADFGPFGYVRYRNRRHIPGEELNFLTRGRAEEIASEFITRYFGEIPEDSTVEMEHYNDPFEGPGYRITYRRVYEGYEILSGDKFLGDFMEVKIFRDSGCLTFERLWHEINRFTRLLYGTLKPAEEVILERFEEEIKSGKRLDIHSVELIYYFNPMKFTRVRMRPSYRINMNGRYYYADGLDGGRVPWIKRTADSVLRSNQLFKKPIIKKE